MSTILLTIGIMALAIVMLIHSYVISELLQEMEKIKRQSPIKDWSKELDDRVKRLKL